MEQVEFFQTVVSLLVLWGGAYSWFKYLGKINDELKGGE